MLFRSLENTATDAAANTARQAAVARVKLAFNAFKPGLIPEVNTR